MIHPKFRIVRYPGSDTFCVERRVLLFFKVPERDIRGSGSWPMVFESQGQAQAHIDWQLRRQRAEFVERARVRADRGWRGRWQP